MRFTNPIIYLIFSLFYIQTIINEIIFIDKIESDFIFSLYNILFSLSYCAIITKVLYSYCHIIWHTLTIIFLYTFKYFTIRKEIFLSYKYLYLKLMNITVWNGMCIKYNYRNSLKPFIALSSIYNIFDNSKNYLVNLFVKKIENSLLVHISCILNILLIYLNYKINDTKHTNTIYFDLISNKFIMMFLFSGVTNFIYFSDNLNNDFNLQLYISIFILQNYINICAYKNSIKYIIISLPVFILLIKVYVKSQIMLESTYNNIVLPILYILSMQYHSNGRIYTLNICYIILPTIVGYVNIKNEYMNCLNIVLYGILYYIYEIIKINIKKENQHYEENSIKNNIDIIINE